MTLEQSEFNREVRNRVIERQADLIRRQHEMLKRLEFVDHEGYGEECPECEGGTMHGHKDACALAALLKEVEGDA